MDNVALLVTEIDWASILDAIVTIFELIAALIIFYGSARAVAEILASVMRRHAPDYSAIRLEYSKKIVLALEFFIANDLVRTILEPALNQVTLLAIIVGIRTVVGLSLNRELKELEEHELPTQQTEMMQQD